MRVLTYVEPGRVEVQEVPIPDIGPGDVLVAVRACGICATDVKVYHHGHRLIRPGSVLGHEIAGRVVATGADVSGWRVGDRVVVAPYVPCGACDMCHRGLPTLCRHLFENAVQPGGFSEYVRVPAPVVAQGLLPLPDHLDFATGTLTEPVACCLHGLEALEMEPGDSLLIIGDGPMGLLHAGLSRLLGAEPIIVAGLTPHRLRWAERVAEHVVNVAEVELKEAVDEITRGEGVDRLIVSISDARAIEEGVELMKRGGIVNLFAGLSGNATVLIDPNRIHYDGIRLLGTFGFAPEHFRRALEIIAQGKIALEGFITRTVALEQVGAAMKAGTRYRGIKSVVVMEER